MPVVTIYTIYSNFQKVSISSTECIYVFHMILAINRMVRVMHMQCVSCEVRNESAGTVYSNVIQGSRNSKI
jgi:hypothetical protein